MMAAHARLSPSDSGRWLNCPGSINFTAKIKENRSSVHAAEGTVAHSVREDALFLGCDAYEFIGQVREADGMKFEVTEEMADFLQPGIDEIRQYEGEMFIEERLDLGRWMPGQFGTLDVGIAGKKLIVISDLKFGSGVAVSAVKNTQQMIYALGFWDQIARHITDATDFLIIIDQPRNAAGGGSWSITLDELLAFGDELAEKAKLTESPDAPLIPSDYACQWCPAANVPGRPGGCPAHHQAQAALLDLHLEELDDLDDLGIEWSPPSFDALTPQRRAHIVRQKSSIEKWLERLHADELALRISDGPAHGLKAVAGRRPPQKWRDPAPAQAYLEKRVDDVEKIFTKKLITPTQAAKVLGLSRDQQLPSTLIDRGEPKPVLVPEADKRPAINHLDAVDDFDDLD